MARIRSLKPELWEDESIGRCSRDAMLLFIGLISHADDEGRQRGGPRLLLANVFPYHEDVESTHIAEWLEELELANVIVCYVVAGQRYLQIRNWAKHQRVDHPKPSSLPPPVGVLGKLPEGRGAPVDPPVAPPVEPLSPPVAPVAPVDPPVASIAPATTGVSGSLANLPESNATDGMGREEDGMGREGNPGGAGDAISGEILTEVEQQAVVLCTQLADAVAANGARRPNPDQKRWRDAARLLIEADGVPADHVAWMIRWSSQHEFWRAVILSMPNLRSKWDQLKLQAQREHDRSGAGRVDALEQLKE